jgi:hypothetical protein
VEDETVAPAFMRGPDESDVCAPQVDKVEEFCFGANLESPPSRERGKSANPSLLGWMVEVSREGKVVQEPTEDP